MRIRKGISPFIATVILVAITLTLGGVLYNQFSSLITAEVRNPSVTMVSVNVGGDGQTVVASFKNDGDVEYTVSKFLLDYQATEESFVLGTGGNCSVIAGVPQLSPGSQLTVKFTVTGVTMPDFSTFTLTVVADQIARAFTVQT